VSTSDNQRRNAEKWPRPFGLRPQIGASGVALPGNGTTTPRAWRLATTDLRAQRDHGYF
jgi:hypothetical protein